MKTGSTSSACAPPTHENEDARKYHSSDGTILTPDQISRLDAIEAQVGDSVDFPPAPEANWAKAVRGKHYKPAQGSIPICLDPDVLAWLRAKGPGYQTAVNRILRERMLAEAAT